MYVVVVVVVVIFIFLFFSFFFPLRCRLRPKPLAAYAPPLATRRPPTAGRSDVRRPPVWPCQEFFRLLPVFGAYCRCFHPTKFRAGFVLSGVALFVQLPLLQDTLTSGFPPSAFLGHIVRALCFLPWLSLFFSFVLHPTKFRAFFLHYLYFLVSLFLHIN